METKTQEKLCAAIQVTYGVARIGAALATATGHGLVGAMLRNHGQMGLAWRLAEKGCRAGNSHIEDGVARWKEAG